MTDHDSRSTGGLVAIPPPADGDTAYSRILGGRAGLSEQLPGLSRPRLLPHQWPWNPAVPMPAFPPNQETGGAPNEVAGSILVGRDPAVGPREAAEPGRSRRSEHAPTRRNRSGARSVPVRLGDSRATIRDHKQEEQRILDDLVWFRECPFVADELEGLARFCASALKYHPHYWPDIIRASSSDRLGWRIAKILSKRLSERWLEAQLFPIGAHMQLAAWSLDVASGSRAKPSKPGGHRHRHYLRNYVLAIAVRDIRRVGIRPAIIERCNVGVPPGRKALEAELPAPTWHLGSPTTHHRTSWQPSDESSRQRFPCQEREGCVVTAISRNES